MGFEGSWNIRINSPMGEQQVRLELRAEDGVLTGTASLGGDCAPLLDPVQEGDRLRWSQDITKPMAMTIHFDLTRSGDTLSGKAKPGFFPAMDVQGERAI
jgi:hypothetical protein